MLLINQLSCPPPCNSLSLCSLSLSLPLSNSEDNLELLFFLHPLSVEIRARTHHAKIMLCSASNTGAVKQEV